MKNSIQILFTILFSSCLIFLSSCEKEDDHDHDSVQGCMDEQACNYDSTAEIENNDSCVYPNECDSCEDDNSCLGCTDPIACNYNESATVDNGSCQIPIDGVLEIIGSIEQTVFGSVGETLEASVLLKNSSCNDVEVMARELYNGSGVTQFCFAGTCYPPNTQIALDILNLPSFVIAQGDIDDSGTDDTFKAYFTPEEEGTFQVNYRFYLENDPTTSIEISINYIVS